MAVPELAPAPPLPHALTTTRAQRDPVSQTPASPRPSLSHGPRSCPRQPPRQADIHDNQDQLKLSGIVS